MITAIVDLQYGSTGKGLLAGYLSQKEDFETVVSANMPNAGHTFVDSHGEAWVNKVLPSGVYSKSLKQICVGPGAVFDLGQLEKEIRALRERGIQAEVLVHECAGILLPDHTEVERNTLNSISSTMQGSMAAMIQKMRRTGESNVAHRFLNEVRDAGATVITNGEWVGVMHGARNILVEGSQGYSLGINAGFYPYCTSRDCTVWRLLADAAVPLKRSEHKQVRTIGTARVHPIRVGSTASGWSGGCYPDQRELTWEEIGQKPETTTVTGRVRRVFSFSIEQITEAMVANAVDEVFLNFCNYDPREAIAIANKIDEIGTAIGGDDPFVTKERTVRYLGFGPRAEDVLEVGRYD